MRKIILASILAAVALPAAPALADPPRHAPAYGYRDHDRHDRYDRRDRYSRYDTRGRYREPHVMRRNDRIWRGRDGRYYCRRDNGTTGLVIGAAVGGLAGHEIAGYGDKTIGTLLGALGGGLLGREIDRGDLKCR
ncbi:hypothetical protein MB02_12685 [Croceicoccus estronivorus]|uniref:glycine zipper 2TM domain-containing protein n=1 Tax=Croceicoccus estronivorus TaxID=1172626 RepID=UPI00082ADC52|nr:glycine zipper 2TM domain-containing protein [Croceicoccus estronivorus]OCC23034.1 hypothetical protein MB02_12685 [Croceicoccus estronivorus]